MKRGGAYSRAQAAVEFIIILVIVLIVFLVIISTNDRFLGDVSIDYNANLVRASLSEVSAAAAQVYRQGEGAKTTVTITLPQGINTSTVGTKQIAYKVRSRGTYTDFFRSFDFQVLGSLPTQQGLHRITLEARDGYVMIGTGALHASPLHLAMGSAPGNRTSRAIVIRNDANETLAVGLQFLGDVELTVNASYPASLNMGPGENKSFFFNVTVPTYVTKTRYFGTLRLNASDPAQAIQETLFIDVIVDVLQGVVQVQNSAAFIYPTRWDSILVPNQSASQQFILCSGYPFLEQYNVTFSADELGSWLSFSPMNKTALLSLAVSSNECEAFLVYQTANTTFEGNYVGAIESVTPDDAPISSLVYTTVEADNILPNLTGINLSAQFGVVDDEVCVFVNASDNSELADVWVDVVRPDNSLLQVFLEYESSSCANSTGLYSERFVLSQPGWYYLNQTYARDISGNVANLTIGQLIHAKQVIFSETPVFAIEEDNPSAPPRDQWNATPFAVQNDSQFATTQDENGYIPDHVDYIWGNFSINASENISQLKLTFVHRDRFNDDGYFDYNDPSEDHRHKIECYKDGGWLFLETYGLNRDPDVWNVYELLDLSRCIEDAADLDGFQMRITFDPADVAGGSYQDIDFLELTAVTTSTEQVNLWEIVADKPQPVDFTSGLNATANTFGWGLGDDGWDYEDDVYTNSSAPASFVEHGDPDGFADYTSGVDRIEVRMGPGSSQELEASGAWGVEFNITESMYDLIDKGARMYYSFNYYVEDIDNDLEEACWVKARFNGTYLGTDLDGHPAGYYLHYSDDTPDIYAIVDTEHPGGWNEIIFRSFGTDVTDLITAPGQYYLDVGGKVDFRTGSSSSKASSEGCGVSFDNIRLMIVE